MVMGSKVEENGVPGQNHWRIENYYQISSHHVVSSTYRHLRESIWRLLTVLDLDCIGRCRSNYNMITVTTAQRSDRGHTMCYRSEMLSILSMQVNLQWCVLILRWRNEKQNYHNVGTATKLNRTIVLIGKIDKHTYTLSFSPWLGISI